MARFGWCGVVPGSGPGRGPGGRVPNENIEAPPPRAVPGAFAALSRGVLPLSPPPPSPAGGRGGARLVWGWSRFVPAGPVLLGWRRGALIKGGGPVPRSDLGKTRQGSLYPARGAFRGYQLRYQKLGLDRIERTCYYDKARLVPPLRGPTSWVVRGIGEKKLSFWTASFFALSLRAAAPRFPRVRAARPWAKSPPTPPGFSRLDKPENCQLGFVPMTGNVSNRADTYIPACDRCKLVLT